MFALKETAVFRQEIRKSRFIATAGTVSDERTAKAFIVRHSDPEAGHNCWAWRIGQTYRFSDDGEPGGTAGRPILQAIEGQDVDGCAVVVTRWFGGILLGSGGLIRAYGGAAASCLRLADKSEIIALVPARLVCQFSDLALLKARLLGIADLRIDAETFTGTGAEFVLSLPPDSVDQVARLVLDITSGRAVFTRPD